MAGGAGVFWAVSAEQVGLLAGLTVALSALTWGLGGLVRWVPLVGYVMAFLFSAAWGEGLGVPGLLGALLLVAGLGALGLRDSALAAEVAALRRVTAAFQEGSGRLVEANRAEDIVRAGVSMLADLGLAPNLAYVGYVRGTPQVLGARGAFVEQLHRPIYQVGDSHSVQADHALAEEVLALLPSEVRGHYLSVPVTGGGHDLGLLVFSRPGAPFSAAERGMLESCACLIGSQLGQWEAICELRAANDLTLRSLGAALERRDDETGGHTTRVVGASVRLARSLGWDEERIAALRRGAYLHDLGKLAIPDRVLHKRGPLDTEERRIIESHSVIGYNLLQDLHFLPAETLDLVRHHHERWDGSGYPARLRGHDIPETARLFAVVDVYDALTSARPYKAAWSRPQALQELRAQAGRQLDPQYVAAFVEMIEADHHDDVRLVS
ncbi:HD domain-containing protein [Deinococcus sp. SDU3-2]|uniref:HD domain-containing protein n=2 Tax=Deinococcus terrestris TaxID=2651870 RepID=A0A7X1TR10_9DEIO|nr:HD domain-containing protein [Deinococcus terrestris]